MEIEGHQRLYVKKSLYPLAVPSGCSVEQRTGEGQGQERGDQPRGSSSLGERAVVVGTREVAVGMEREERETTKRDIFRAQARCDGLHGGRLLVVVAGGTEVWVQALILIILVQMRTFCPELTCSLPEPIHTDSWGWGLEGVSHPVGPKTKNPVSSLC